MKKLLCSLLSVILLIAFASGASAGKSLGSSTNSSSIAGVKDFLFSEMKDGIGCGDCPVYTAPSMNAYRANNGKALCSTDSPMFIAGFNAERWLLVRYSTNNGATRVGYIPPSYVRGFKSTKSISFAYVPATAATTLYVTDNPLDNYSAFAELEPGETYYILASYTYHGNWWYIECTVDGQVARGFIAK